MLTNKFKAAVKTIIITGALTVLSTVSVLAAPVDYETFVKSTLAGEFVLPSSVMSEFKEAINSGDTDRGMEIYRDYFDGDDTDGISYEVADVEDADDETDEDAPEAAAEPEEAKAEVKVEEVKAEEAKAEPQEVKEEKAPEAPKESEVLGETKAPEANGDHYGLSDADYMNLCKIVHAEAHTQGVAGMQLVANVVLNRVKNYRFPNSVTAVIAQPGQFSPVASGKFAATMPGAAAMAAVDNALAGEDNSRGALYFRRSTSTSNWGTRMYMFTYGGQSFYIN